MTASGDGKDKTPPAPMAGGAAGGPDAPPERRVALGRADWIEAACAALKAGGVGDVKIDRLAGDLNISRGSFYWHFNSRKELLEAVLKLWDERNTRPFLEVLESPRSEPRYQIMGYFNIWRADSPFDPDLDSAVRDWARLSAEVAEAVRHADDRRLSVLEKLFIRIGYGPTEALVRARASYYHQVGYYALGIRQTPEERAALMPMYFRVLTGFPMPADAGDPPTG